MNTMTGYIFDGEGRILGRMGSSVAKLLLQGNDVVVVNAEKIVISGHICDIISKYKRRIELRDKANPEHSPYYSRRPDLFVKRVFRGMLPYRTAHGREAYRRLRVYMGMPEELKKSKPSDIVLKHGNEVYERVVTIAEISEKLGYR